MRMHASFWLAALVMIALLGGCCGVRSARLSPPLRATPTATPRPPTATPIPPSATPPPPTVDVGPIKTAAAATAVAEVKAALTATFAAIPTATPSPLPSATLPSATSTASATPQPTTAPTVPVALTFRIMTYEKWGRPVDGCRAFDDNSPMRKYNIEITLRNDAHETITDWYPAFWADNGAALFTCYYGYGEGQGFPAIPAGEQRAVTFASFCEQNKYVSEMSIVVLGQELRRCFAPSGQMIACP